MYVLIDSFVEVDEDDENTGIDILLPGADVFLFEKISDAQTFMLDSIGGMAMNDNIDISGMDFYYTDDNGCRHHTEIKEIPVFSRMSKSNRHYNERSN